MEWLLLGLLLVLIGVAVWLLLRRPSGTDADAGEDTTAAPYTDADPTGTSGYGAGAAGAAGAGVAGAGATAAGTAGAGVPYDQTADDRAYTEPGYAADEATYQDTATGEQVPTPEAETDATATGADDWAAAGGGTQAPSADDRWDDSAASGATAPREYEAGPTAGDGQLTDDAHQGHPGPDSQGMPEDQLVAEDQGYPGPDSRGAHEDQLVEDDQGHPGTGGHGSGTPHPEGAPTTGEGQLAAHERQGHPGPGSQGAPEDELVEEHQGHPGPGSQTQDVTDTGYVGGGAYPPVDEDRTESGPTATGGSGATAYSPAADTSGGYAPTENAQEGDFEYDEARAGAVDGGAAAGPVYGSFGPGSAEPAADGSGPAGWEVKGNAGSMLYHTPESPSYESSRAEVWFESEEAARAAGFAHWDRKRR